MFPLVHVTHTNFPPSSTLPSGVFEDKDCKPDNLDHAVTLVGFGTENGKDYWVWLKVVISILPFKDNWVWVEVVISILPFMNYWVWVGVAISILHLMDYGYVLKWLCPYYLLRKTGYGLAWLYPHITILLKDEP